VYAAAHPDLGYACQLKQLQPTENTPPEVSYATPINFQVGESAGYKFEIVGCAPDKDGVLTHYQVTAVPLKPGLSGVQAFCTDESGSVFYDLNGSASECLAAKRHTVPWTSPD
jgi:hypothetical protein